MKVTLINHTPNAIETLIFTKNTRLNMGAANFKEIMGWPDEQKATELEYMANTIPSSWEFVDYTFAIEGVSRGFTHQFVRNRHGSYAQQSMRVTEMGGFDYVEGPTIEANPDSKMLYDQIMGEIQDGYDLLIKDGIAIEDARGVLPTNIATNIVAKFNLRTMSELARSRVGGRTQGEFQGVMEAMVQAVLRVHPWAHQFLYPKGKEFFDEIEEYARGDRDRPALLKIIDKMRKRI